MNYSDDIQLHKRFDLTGHRAFITGSARGIGRAIAMGLAEYGAQVIVHGVKESEKLASALESVRKLSPTSFAVTGDLGARSLLMRGRERRSKSSGILFFRIAVWNMEYGMGFALGDYAWAFSLKELIASMISFHSFGLKMSAILPKSVNGVFRKTE